MGRTVDDLIILDEAITGQEFDSKITTLKGVRLGVSSDDLCANLEPEVSAAFGRAKAVLQRAGAELVDVDFAQVRKLHDACGWVILTYGMRVDLGAYLIKHAHLTLEQLSAHIASPDVKLLFDKFVLGDEFNAEQYNEALSVVRPQLIQAYHDLFEASEIAALVFPTLPCLPTKFTDIKEDSIAKFIRNCSPCSVSGMPGLSIPMNDASDRLPIGLEFDGLENTDQDILAIGKLTQELLKGELDLISF
jgi:Asp-tRNA(Asn)/Glu-tRNA(Gln) amidotransferase A subunit family amidase